MSDFDWFPNEEYAEDLYQQAEELYQVPNATPTADGVIELPAVLVRGPVVYPNMLLPLWLEGAESLMAVDAARAMNSTVIGLYPAEDTPPYAFKHHFLVATEMAIRDVADLEQEGNMAMAQGRRRVEVLNIRFDSYPIVRARLLQETRSHSESEIEALARTVLNMLEEVVMLDNNMPEEILNFVFSMNDPSWVADVVGVTLRLPYADRLRLLAELDVGRRLEMAGQMLARELEVLELEDEIHARVRTEMNRSQREAYLREQMRAIQTELGEGDLWMNELNELRERIEKTGLPEEARARALKEVQRLSQIPPMSPEVGILRTYIDWLLELPWNQQTEDNLDIRHVAEVLEANHYGLPQVKERLLEYIAVRSLKPKRNHQPILCFVGPPGTGKTSLGKSIAEALGRKFVRLSLGGVHDEAEIRGHRRTYIGALPGRILQTMRRAGTINPVFMLDEVDKLGADYRGDPAAALLEVLDPEQNHAFSDHYLELPYDLSQVMFITTANTTDTIPAPLLDRMEVIRFPGYVDHEKIEIARRFLIPRQIEANGLDGEQITFSSQAIQKIIREYTFEAGVRNLEREIGKVLRKIARLKAEGREYPTRIGVNMIERFLGPPKNLGLEPEREDAVGVAMGLAWTADGGEVLPVEVALMDGKGNLQMTGQLGEVMQESVQAAMTYLKSRARWLRLDPTVFERTDVHIHLPEGAIPKDGPSAGVTVATALVSAFTGRKVRHDVGLTGEITLRGRVLPVGGVREKVLTAHRVGLKTVVLPRKNMKDLVHVPRQVRHELNLVPVDHMDEVLKVALAAGRGRPWRPTPTEGE